MSKFDWKNMSLSTQDLVSFLAVFVAIIAALYARWAGVAAERANEIAIHTERLNIFKAIRNFQYEIERCGLDYPAEAHAQLAQMSDLAEFYFTPQMAQNLNNLVNLSQNFVSERDKSIVQDAIGQPIVPPHARQILIELHREVCIYVRKSLGHMKIDLRLTRFSISDFFRSFLRSDHG